MANALEPRATKEPEGTAKASDMEAGSGKPKYKRLLPEMQAELESLPCGCADLWKTNCCHSKCNGGLLYPRCAR